MLLVHAVSEFMGINEFFPNMFSEEVFLPNCGKVPHCKPIDTQVIERQFFDILSSVFILVVSLHVQFEAKPSLFQSAHWP